MAYFAHVVAGVVTRVHVVADAEITDSEGVVQESVGQDFLANLHGYAPEDLVQCSYDGSFRGSYPGIGFTYDVDRDAFIPPQPFPLWVLDEATCLWEAPVAQPDDGKMYTWDGTITDWIEVDNEPN